MQIFNSHALSTRQEKREGNFRKRHKEINNIVKKKMSESIDRWDIMTIEGRKKDELVYQ